jgi:hypothetical protein
MRVEPVDPRDTHWEEMEPGYRVYIWSRAPVPLGVDPDLAGWSCRSDDVFEADVGEVLEWAKREAPLGGTFTMFARSVRDGPLGLLRLAGWEPPRRTEPPAWVER